MSVPLGQAAARTTDGLHYGFIHYTRRDPEGDAVSEHLDWRRTVVPGDEARSKPWEPVARRQYDSEGLLATAREEAEGA